MKGNKSAAGLDKKLSNSSRTFSVKLFDFV